MAGGRMQNGGRERRRVEERVRALPSVPGAKSKVKSQKPKVKTPDALTRG